MTVSINEPLAPQNYIVPFAGGGFLGVNTLGTAAIQVIPADPTRMSISFINPNMVTNINVAVFPVADINGNSLLGTTFGQGGGAPLVPGGIITFVGDSARLAWAAVAASSSNVGLTIVPSRT